MVWDENSPAVEWARQVLPRLASEFFAAGRDIVRSSPTSKELHQLRLAAKRFRYTLELFRQCYDDGLQHQLEALGDLQSRLGSFNDCEVAMGLVKSASPQVAGCEEFLLFLTENGEEKRNACLHYWDKTFDVPGKEQFWLKSLSRPAEEHAGKGRTSRTRPGSKRRGRRKRGGSAG